MTTTMKWKQERRQRWSDWWKLKNGCAVCGYRKHPRALSYDHLDSSTKHPATASGSRAGGMFQLTHPKYPLRVMVNEWRKCRILCMNCHMEDKYEKEKERRDRKIAENGSASLFD